MKINVHAGHNPDGKTACGAVGLVKESTEARKIAKEVIEQLKELDNTVYNCTVNDGKNQSDVLVKIVKKCNAHTVDLDVSIHLNSGRNDKKGDGDNAGVEVLVLNSKSKAKPYAEKVCKAVSELGFDNRGVKYSDSLYFLKNTKAPAMLIECFFVDDADDIKLYDYESMASAIVKGITGKTVKKADDKKIYRVQVGAFSKKENAEAMQKKLKKAGFDSTIVS